MTKLFRLSLLLSALVATPVMAESSGPTADRIVVVTADLDLGSAAGQRMLDRRLTQAVIEACGTASDVDLAGGNEVRRCLKETRIFVSKEREQRIAAASARPILLAAR